MSGVTHRLPLAVCREIKLLLDTGYTAKAISDQLNVHIATIYRMKRCLAAFDDFYPPSGLATGRPAALNSDQSRVRTSGLVYLQS